MKLADVVPKHWAADYKEDWIGRVQVKTPGDTVWRKATEDDWWRVQRLGFLRDALRMGVAPPARCTYRGPNWYGEEDKRYRSSWSVEVGRGPKNLIVDDPDVWSWYSAMMGGRGFGKGYGRRRLVPVGLT